MLEISQLQSFLDDQRNIIVDLNISVENMSRLTLEKYEFESQIKEHGFFRHHIYQLKFILIIQVSKLFSSKKSEERSFFKLCNKLETSEYGDDLRNLMENNKDKGTVEIKSKEDVLLVVNEVRYLINSKAELIQRVISLRDQVYAHIDHNRKTQTVSLDELKILVELANKIHNLIRFKIFFTQTMFNHIHDWSIDYVLWYMAEMRKMDMEELERKEGILPK